MPTSMIQPVKPGQPYSRKRSVLLFAGLTGLLLTGSQCGSPAVKKAGIPDRIPAVITDSVYLDPGNIYSEEKRELGRYLFYDTRLSVNNTRSCASCHDPRFSFADNYNRSIGAYGDLHQRNSRPLINLIFNRYLTGADTTVHFPELQMIRPLMSEHPVEMGMKGNETAIVQRLQTDALYRNLFSKAYPAAAADVTVEHIRLAIADFIKTIISSDAAYDRYRYDSLRHPLSAAAMRGKQLFFSDKLACYQCHGGLNFDKPLLKTAAGKTDFYFNTGLYNIDGKGSYPATDHGLAASTGNPADEGKFRVPILRNLIFTAPYLHDGSAQTLEEVIRVYEEGGRNLTRGPNAGDGRKNPFKDPLIKGFVLTAGERKDLIHFLYSLTDSVVLNKKENANPFR